MSLRSSSQKHLRILGPKKSGSSEQFALNGLMKSAPMQSRQQSSRLGWGASVYQGGPKFEIKHESRCLQKVSLLYGGAKHVDGGPGPPGPAPMEIGCLCVQTRPGVRAVDLGGQAFIRGEPKFEIKHKSQCFQKSKLVDWGAWLPLGVGPGPNCKSNDGLDAIQ